MENTTEKYKVNIKEEIGKINCDTICEFKNTVENFEIDKIRVCMANDEGKAVCLMFYGGQFIAINRVNFPDGYEYENKNLCLSENLNYRIRKIPNVAKTRKILNIDNIEARIYDVSEYVVLLEKENMTLLKVKSQKELEKMQYMEYKLEKEEILQKINGENLEEEQQIQKTKLSEILKNIFIKPLIMLKQKIMKTNEVKMLSDGKHSIFEKIEE